VVVTVTPGITWDLIGHAYDKDEAVRLSIAQSLQKLGQSQPELVLSAAAEFIRRVSAKGAGALEHGHRVQILRIMRDVAEEVRDRLPTVRLMFFFFCFFFFSLSHSVGAEICHP
jgi:hypothetical protein